MSNYIFVNYVFFGKNSKGREVVALDGGGQGGQFLLCKVAGWWGSETFNA